METIRLSFAFCILWFFANYTTNASLAYTSVGSSTILASMSGNVTTNKEANASNSLPVDRFIHIGIRGHV
jgi:hypothetical protein